MNMQSVSAALLATCATLLSLRSARADAPAYIPIQGYLADASDTPISGAVSIRFRLYDKATAGAVLFDETKSVVNVEKGYFTAYLGEDAPIALTVFRDHPEHWTQPTRAPIEPLRHANVHCLGPLLERLVASLRENVNVASHQRVSQQAPLGASQGERQSREIRGSLPVTRKSCQERSTNRAMTW